MKDGDFATLRLLQKEFGLPGAQNMNEVNQMVQLNGKGENQTVIELPEIQKESF